MALTDSFYNAVSANNVTGIRIMMKDSLLVDPTFREFDDMEKAARSVPGLYDIHDGRELKASGWDDDYMNKQMVQVIGNFSRERIDHLKKVVRYLRPEAVKAAEARHAAETGRGLEPRRKPQGGSISYQEQKRRDMESGNYRTHKIVAGTAAGAAVGFVAGGAMALVISSAIPAIVGTAAGAMIGAAAASMTSGGD